MEEDHPPVFSKWSHWYWIILLALISEILLLSWLTFSFS
jgi:hypothetical protein